MEKFKSFLSTTAGRVILAIVSLGAAHQGYQAWTATPNAPSGSGWFTSGSGSGTVSGPTRSTEFVIRNLYTTQSGRVLVGSCEDYMDPSNQTVVVPVHLARQHQLLAGKTLKVTGQESTYKGKKQLVAQSLEVK